ncbi:DoxX family protein [Actinobacteria bacterium OV450]|nr:DoxX family protein [Actinobacteria bacterium OV450]
MMFKLLATKTTIAAGPYVLSMFRIVVGFLFLCHGFASLFGLLGGAHGTGGTLDPGTWPEWYAGLIQLFGGAMITIGALTRPAALLSSGSMAYAYFTVHHPKSLWPLENGGELAALFCWAFLLIVFMGPGPVALDAAFKRRHSTHPQKKKHGESG